MRIDTAYLMGEPRRVSVRCMRPVTHSRLVLLTGSAPWLIGVLSGGFALSAVRTHGTWIGGSPVTVFVVKLHSGDITMVVVVAVVEMGTK